MQHLSASDLTIILLSLAVLLIAACTLSEIAQRLHLPGVVGEVLAGILLGPTAFGTVAPAASAFLFPNEGPVASVLDGMSNIALVLFLLVAGMEVDLSTAWRQGVTALRIAFVGTLVPFVVGFVVAWSVPSMLGRLPSADPKIFSLFFATAIAISALPVIVKILMDLNLYRSDFGMVVVAACVLNDLCGWMVFATILGLLGKTPPSGLGIGSTIAMTFGFAGFMLTAGRWLVHRILPWLHAYSHRPGGVLSFSLAIALIGAAFTEWIGVHAVFGSFLVGIAIGDSSFLRERTRATINHFISFIFAPLFFASIGLRVNFAMNFDLGIVTIVTVTAATAKITGCALGARWGRMSRSEAIAVGCSMSSVGAMGIIVGLLALQYNLITEQLFVGLVIMALVTAILSGPSTQYALGRRKPRRLEDLLSSQSFVRHLQGTTQRDVIQELSRVASLASHLEVTEVGPSAIALEETLHTRVVNGVAVPHARVDGLKKPFVAVGISPNGVDFNSTDGRAARIIFFVLTGQNDSGAQTDILAAISKAFNDPAVAERALTAKTLTEFLAAIRSDDE